MSSIPPPAPPAPPLSAPVPPPPSGSAGQAGELAATADLARQMLNELEKAVVGKRDALELIIAGLLADGHVLLDDLPGLAKTLTARSIATVAGLSFNRVQFTPDVLPSDITGATVLDLATNKASFQRGPVFSQLVLADEINRAPAKTQAALLEAMQERQVTADGVTHALPSPFLVIATENPIESEGTYALPEAQLDRFMLRTRLGYPLPNDELELLSRRMMRGQDDVTLQAVTDPAGFLTMQRTLERVHLDPALLRYIIEIVTATRAERDLDVGASPRGSLALMKMARAKAVLSGRDFVTPDDIRAIAVPALSHRVVLASEAWARRVSPEDVVRRTIDRVPAPTWR
jgi:MoxR-like ATPase